MPTFLYFGGIHGALCVGRDELLSEISAAAGRVASSYGLDLFDVGLRRESIGWVLRVILDCPPAAEVGERRAQAAVSVGDCERVSRDLSAILDAEIAFSHPYTLEVSSPGLDRPLRHLGDCRRFRGCLARLVTTEAVDGQYAWRGRIADVLGDDVVIEATDRARRIPWALVSRARLDVEFG